LQEEDMTGVDMLKALLEATRADKLKWELDEDRYFANMDSGRVEVTVAGGQQTNIIVNSHDWGAFEIDATGATVEEYLQLVAALAAELPDAAIRQARRQQQKATA
jgi:hypothetical protein